MSKLQVSLRQLNSSNPDVRAFHVVLQEKVVGLVVEEGAHKNSDWRVTRLGEYGMIARFYRLTMEAMIEAVKNLNPELFLESREYCFVQVTTLFGQTLYLNIEEDTESLSAVYFTTERRSYFEQMFDANFFQWVENELYDDGDYPVSIGIIKVHENQSLRVHHFPTPGQLYV